MTCTTFRTESVLVTGRRELPADTVAMASQRQSTEQRCLQ